MNIDLKNLTIEKAHESLKKGEYSCLELAEAYLAVIKEKDADIHAYLEVYKDINEQAEVAQKMFSEGKDVLLTGIPFSIKDNILITGKVSSAGSKILENYTASYDATVITELKKAGAVFLGRVNMDEFAMGSSTEYSAYGPSKNPYDLTRVPGGTSGGSAASVAADMALVSLGTETCGSAREPAAFCGLVAIKPTYGGISRHGVIAMANSLDQVSPMGKTVKDVEIVWKALSKNDKNDATSIRDEDRIPKKNITTKKIGVPWHLFEEGLPADIMQNFKDSVEKFKKDGYEIVDIQLPYSKYSLAVYYIIMPAEVSTNLSRFDGSRYGARVEGESIWEMFKKSRSKGFGKETRRRVILGTYVLSHGFYDAYYNKAWKVRRAIMKETDEAFKLVDFIMTPTVPFLPFKLGEKMSDPVAMYLCDLFNAPANLTGTPSMAVPSGFSKEGLPFSVQITAPHFCEDNLFEIGKKFETIR
ncbi:MAG: Asp-tRNA(Asn)/Glu-tRNA(Gln) amidotransferase subunit GatA [Candidatus Nomurabacteria bacterium]|nr:Asp-tRNA(Asn)/Glu-tRNA(Gln) amidotransferase subunit GatA [Candidatus Nomurabacteria bacterium]